MRKLGFIVTLFFCASLIYAHTSPTQAQQDIITLTVEAGYDGRFRENAWVPVLINVTNNGDAISGRLTARPERSSALTNTFTTMIDLPSNARQTIFMYVSLRAFGRSLRIELFDAADTLVIDREVPIQVVSSTSQLYVVVSNSTSNTLNLTAITPAGTEAYQANWFPGNIPGLAAALQSIDVMIFNDTDSGTLSLAQRQAIRDWVLQGGHLIVTGGANWQATAAGLTELLPLRPNSSVTVNDLSGLSALAGRAVSSLSGQSVIAVGELMEGAQIMAVDAENRPLVTRQSLGNGVVDYLAADPTLTPLHEWAGQDELWRGLLTSVNLRPGWTFGFINPDQGVRALELLPGVNAMPEAMAMVGFLAAYILLIGPVNYLILNRLNRKELAWVTIPVLIGVFSVLAWVTGFNLRGNEVILSRLSVVQSWPDSDRAAVNQFIGLLAPRRASYSLAVTDERALRPIASGGQTTGFLNTAPTNSASGVEVSIGERFAARDFLVDASEVRGFSTAGFVEKPRLSGQVSISYAEDGRQQLLRGSVRNDSDLTLLDPVILFRGEAHRLGTPLIPGDLIVFGGSGLELATENATAPTPLEYEVGTVNINVPRYYYGWNQPDTRSVERSAQDIIGAENYRNLFFSFSPDTSVREQELFRRQLFLNAFMVDQHYAAARGLRVYLAGWTDSTPTREDIGGAVWRSVDSTLYIVELTVQLERPSTPVTVTQDQFTWTAVQRDNINMVSPNFLTLSSDTEVAFRFTPLPDVRLAQVDELIVVFTDRQGSVSGRTMSLNLWDWEAETWEAVEISGQRGIVPNHQRFIGPNNAVQIQLSRAAAMGSLYIGQLGIEQSGVF